MMKDRSMFNDECMRIATSILFAHCCSQVLLATKGAWGVYQNMRQIASCFGRKQWTNTQIKCLYFSSISKAYSVDTT